MPSCRIGSVGAGNIAWDQGQGHVLRWGMGTMVRNPDLIISNFHRNLPAGRLNVGVLSEMHGVDDEY